jgi:pSer/pThr/pTyr-binding forkhead associated (FHA) protein
VGVLRLKLDAGKKTIEVVEERVVLGRDASAQVVVKDRSVSRKHAVIERRGDAWLVIDQNSSNGTYLDGKRVAEAPLVNGQELRLGTVALRIEIEAPEGDATVLLNMGAPRPETATLLMPPPASRQAKPRASAQPPAPPAPAAPPAQGRSSSFDRAAAAERLGVAPGVAPAEVRRRHDELAKKAEERLAAASTPQLKAHCQRQIDELHAARDVLRSVPAQAAAAAVVAYDPSDLPSAQPVVADGALESVILKPGMLASGSAPTAHVDAGLHPLTKYFGSAAIALVSLALFFMIGRGKNQGLIGKFQHIPEFVSARQNAELYRTTATLVDGGAIVNRQLAVCNVAAEPMRVTWLGALSIESAQEIPKDASSPRVYKRHRFHSAYCTGGVFDVVIPPGGQRTFSFSGADERCRWQGAAVYFGLSAVPASKTNDEDARSLWYGGVPGGENACVKIGAQK